MSSRLCRSPEGLLIYPGQTVKIEQPLIGCFVTAALYPHSAVVTHAGPLMNDLTCNYHQQLKLQPSSPTYLICLALDLSTNYFWRRARSDYESYRQDLLNRLASALLIPPDQIRSDVYAAFADIVVLLTSDGQLQITGLT